MPSTLVAFSTISAPISAPRRSGRGVGREEGVAGARGEDDDLAFFEVTQGLGADVRFDDLVDVQGRLHAGVDTLVLERVLQGKRVHDGGHHAHVVGGGAVHALRTRGDATEDVATADDDGQLDASGGDFGDLIGHADDGGAIDAECIVAHQRLAGKFEKNPFV